MGYFISGIRWKEGPSHDLASPDCREKIEFYEELFELINELETSYNCSDTFVMGDFNLIFKAREAKNRNFPPQEQRIAALVKTLTEDAGLVDLWREQSGFTWRRPNSDIFSTIDRILYPKNLHKLESHYLKSR